MSVLLPDRAYEILCVKSTRLKTSTAKDSWVNAVPQPMAKNEVMYGTYVIRNGDGYVFWVPDMSQFVLVPQGMSKSVRVFTSCGKREPVVSMQ